MIFEEDQFNKYCMGQNYKNTLDIHLIKFSSLRDCYGQVYKRPMGDWLKEQFVLDAGCAMGHTLDDLTKNGVKCEGYEPSNYAIANGLPSVKHKIRQANHDQALPKIADGTYDIVYANSLQYSLNEEDVRRWVAGVSRICTHSLFFVSITVQGMHRCISGSEIWKMQLIKTQKWWSKLFKECGFEEIIWMRNVIAICLKQHR
jgi:hypothetical protein